jgi:hypothetical protein
MSLLVIAPLADDVLSRVHSVADVELSMFGCHIRASGRNEQITQRLTKNTGDPAGGGSFYSTVSPISVRYNAVYLV